MSASVTRPCKSRRNATVWVGSRSPVWPPRARPRQLSSTHVGGCSGAPSLRGAAGTRLALMSPRPLALVDGPNGDATEGLRAVSQVKAEQRQRVAAKVARRGGMHAAGVRLRSALHEEDRLEQRRQRAQPVGPADDDLVPAAAVVRSVRLEHLSQLGWWPVAHPPLSRCAACAPAAAVGRAGRAAVGGVEAADARVPRREHDAGSRGRVEVWGARVEDGARDVRRWWQRHPRRLALPGRAVKLVHEQASVLDGVAGTSKRKALV